MQIHVPSALAGIVLATAILLSMSQSAPVGPPRIEYGPNPRDMVQIREGMPYVVPAGKLFVLTGLGMAGNLGFTSLTVNGQTEAASYTGCSNGGPATVAPMSPGFSVTAGSTIDISGHGSGEARAWGYLSNQ
jgi:hypothetical protein